METFKKILKIVGITIVTLFVLLVILLVAFPAKSDATENASEDKVTPVKQEVIEYTPCDCADISYKVAKNGGIDAASALDNAKLEACNELMGSPSFMSKTNECPSYLKLQAYYNNLYNY